MKISKAKHFWNWFQRHLATYSKLLELEKKEDAFYWNELSTHLLVFGKGIEMELSWAASGQESNATLVITSMGDSKYFKRINSLVAQAPKFPGWDIVALQPPRPVHFFIAEQFGELNIDPFNLWFESPDTSRSGLRVDLHVYAEVYTGITPAFENAVRAVVFNVLGEKVYGLELDIIYVHSMLNLSKEERSNLINLQQLPGYVKLRELSTIVINGNGSLEDRKR